MTAELPPEAPLAGVRSRHEPSIHQLLDEVRRLSVLVEVADTVTQQISLDHQLPRSIELIIDALDAERATLFLHDRDTGELFSRVLSGEGVTEIRIPSSAGIAGAVFGTGSAEIIADAYQDNRFNPEIDRRTGYRTRNILCVPVRNRSGELIGVTQVLNKRSGDFSAADLTLAEAINRHAASALEQALMAERLDPGAARGNRNPDDRRGDLDRAACRCVVHPDHRGVDAASQRRTLDAVPLRCGDRRAVVAGCRGRRPEGDPHTCAGRYRRCRAILRRLDLIQVKGKSQPTLAYEALDHYDSERFPRLPALIGAYEAGLDSYQRRDWTDAIRHFGTALEVVPSDQPSQVFIDRCRYYSDHPPPENWNGVWIMEDK